MYISGNVCCRSGVEGHLWALGLGVILEQLTDVHIPGLLQVNDRQVKPFVLSILYFFNFVYHYQTNNL